MKKLQLEVKWAHLSDFASLTSDGKINVNGIFDEIAAPTVPATSAQFFISGVFLGEPKTSHLLTLSVESPNKKGRFLIGTPQEIRLGNNGRLNMVLGIGGFVFKEFGKYKLNILEKSEVLISLDLTLKKSELVKQQ